MRLFETKENRLHYRELTLAKYDRHEDKDLGAEWGLKTIIRASFNQVDTMVFELIAFCGTSAKPALHYVYRTPESRDKAVQAWLEGLRRSKAFKDDRKAAKKALNETPNPAKLGDILVSSWGYDQTNVDWYQVVEVVGKNTIRIRFINATSTTNGWERGDCSPIKDSFQENKPVMTVRLNKSKDGYSVKVRDFAWARYEPKGENASHFWTSYA